MVMNMKERKKNQDVLLIFFLFFSKEHFISTCNFIRNDVRDRRIA